MERTHEGKRYTATGDAYLSNRVFPGWWGDAEDGETYVAEYHEPATDAGGEKVTLVWQFPAIKGEEPDDCDFNWSDENIVAVQ